MHLDDATPSQQLSMLEQELANVLEQHGVGFSAGSEHEGKEMVLYFHGPDAQRMRDMAYPILKQSSIRPILIGVNTGSFLAGTREQKSESVQ